MFRSNPNQPLKEWLRSRCEKSWAAEVFAFLSRCCALIRLGSGANIPRMQGWWVGQELSCKLVRSCCCVQDRKCEGISLQLWEVVVV